MSLDLSALEQAPPDGPGHGVAPVAPLDAFEEDPDNPRCEEEGEDFALLVDDVRQRGILQPVVVRRMPSGMLRLRFGQRRYRAARALQLSGMPYVVTEDARQLDDYAQVAENERRKPLQPLELAMFIARKRAQGAKKKEVAQRLGIDASAITHLLALVDQPPPMLLELYHGRRCRSPQYLYELRKLWEAQPVFVAEHAAQVAMVDRAWLARLAAEVERLSATSGHQALSTLTVQEAETLVSAAATTAPEQPGRIRRARLVGCLDGRELIVVLDRMPSRSGLIWVYLDGAIRASEVPIGAVQLTGLSEADAKL